MSDIIVIDASTGQIIIRPMTPEEETQRDLDEQEGEETNLRLLAQVRIQRLRDSDWTQLRDAPLSNQRRTLWASYRQLLRELVIEADLTWPTPPTGSET